MDGFECFGAAGIQDPISSPACNRSSILNNQNTDFEKKVEKLRNGIITSNNVGEDGGVVVDREEEAVLSDAVAADRDAGALELVVVVIPELGLSALGLDGVGGLPGVDAADLALPLLPRAFSNGAAEAEEEEEAQN